MDEPDDDVIAFATKLFDLARSGSSEELAAYLDQGVPVDLTNQSGDTLVMLAAYHGHPATVRALVERGADADRANDRGQTPLAGAVFKGEVGVVRALLDAGADPGAGQPSALAAATLFEREDLLDLLRAQRPPDQP
jgi:ankyrin repeat protein